MKACLYCIHALIVWKMVFCIPELSSKTVYDATRGDIRSVKYLMTDNKEECTPNFVYFILRHGSRNFGSSTTEKMKTFLDKFATLIKSGSIKLGPGMMWYENWINGTYYGDYELVAEGMMEHYTIAMRYKEKFPDLFPIYSISNYSVEATSRMRTIQSAMSFMYGLFQYTGPLGSSKSRLDLQMKGYMPSGILIRKDEENRLLRFVDCCPKYLRYINSEEWKKEGDLFDVMHDFDNVVQSVGKFLRFDATKDDVLALYYLCAAELMSPSQAHQSQFCNVFTEQTISVLDYSKDLDKYYKYSYGYKTNYQMSCVLLLDIIDLLNNTDSTTPVLKFAHEETVFPLLSLMGLFDDGKKLTHATKRYTNRKLKTSKIIPFAGNVAFVRFKCPQDRQHRIQVIVNEKEVKVPLCSSKGCTIADFKAIVKKRANGCNFDKICEIIPKTEITKNQNIGMMNIGLALLLAISLCQATYIFFHCIKQCPIQDMPQKVLYDKKYDFKPLIEDEDECDLNLVTTIIDTTTIDS